jgi:hypothetical protein
MNFVLDVALFVVSASPMLLLWAAILFFPRASCGGSFAVAG